MKKHLAIILCFMTLATYTHATEDRPTQIISSASLYRDNYFTLGDNNDQVKFQFSAKFQIYIPDEKLVDADATPFWSKKFLIDNNFWRQILNSAYIAYTQTSWWTVYSGRDTFSTNYQPEFIFLFERNNSFRNLNLGPVKYIKIVPFYHCSTGVEGSDHRSINEYYGELDISYTDMKNHNEFGFNPRLFAYWGGASRNNRDINDYRHNYEAKIYYNHIFDMKYLKEQGFSFRCTGNPFGKGYYILESKTKVFRTYFQSKFFIQYSRGYGVNIVNYNAKETELRAGVIFDY